LIVSFLVTDPDVDVTADEILKANIKCPTVFNQKNL
jgi:hypothetical protein